MTNEEIQKAINVCEAIIYLFPNSNFSEGMETAIEALEKQQPKKRESYSCPSCRYYFEDGEYHNFCPVCGQAID